MIRDVVKGPGRVRGLLTLVLAGLLLVPATTEAQRVDVELAGGASVGSYTGTDAGLDVLPGPSFGVRADVNVRESLAGYIGFTRSSFGCEEAFCTNRDVTLTSQGLVLGARWSPGLVWARAGMAFQGLDIQAQGGGGESDPALGFELAGGLDFGLGARLRLRPGVRYLRHAADTGEGSGTVAVIAVELGLALPVASF